MNKIFKADVYYGLKEQKNSSISVAITSPPYWAQRNYGFNGQIGNEKTFQDYIEKLVTIFNLLRKKLCKKGVFFLNVGDKYLSKYGNTPLGMIPYKLAYFMVKEGWILNDIIIWYKPNHMPSSIKNRFTNSYEPVFVFSKNEESYFTDKIKKYKEYKNILRINLQPSPYKHVAIYPEKLVESLFGFVRIPDNSIILDPFAGSGTTLKVIHDINEKYSKTYSGIMIDNNEEYIDIIKSRCKLNDKDIEKISFNENNYFPTVRLYNKKKFEQLKLFDKRISKNGINEKGLVKICNNKEDYYDLLSTFENQNIKNFLNKDSICFIGSKEFDIELIYKTSLLNDNDWVIRNVIVVYENDKWFPVFMIADDNKRIKYRFNYKHLNLKHKNGFKEKWKQKSFIGYNVINTLNKEKRIKGEVIDILENYENSFPKYVIVKWENKTYTKEFVVYSEEEINSNLRLIKNNFIIKIEEKKTITELNKKVEDYSNTFYYERKKKKSIYEGKYKYIDRLNRGASPGARSKMEEEYFTLQRLYDVDQKIISDYLNYKRTLKGLSKNELTLLFPKHYKHTVGHWLRNDFGGSIPLPEDWLKLNDILDLDNLYTNYVCKTALRLQMVKHGEFKMPDDFMSLKDIDILQKVLK